MPILHAPKGVTPKQVARLYAIARERFVSSDELRELLTQMGYEDPRDLTREDYDALCDDILPSMDPPTEGRAVDPQTGEVYEDDLSDWSEPACSGCGDTGTETVIIDLPAPYCTHTQERPCDCPGSVNERLFHAERQEEKAA